MANPSSVALYGHRSQLWLKNDTTGSQIVVDRVQSVEPTFQLPTQSYYELARKGKIGITQNPPEYRIVFDQNMVNSLEAEYVLAGKGIAPAGAQSYHMGDILTYASLIRGYVLNLTNAGAVLNEQEYTGLSVAEMSFRFTVGGALMQTVTMIGTTGKLYTAANVVHGAFGALDNVSLGGIHGKDARIWFTSGSVAADRGFRLQNFTIRATFPNVYVRELGTRALAGTLSDSPDVTVDFDILLADDQPTEKFFTLTTFYDYANPVAAFNAFVRVFHPNDAEALTVVKSFKIDNVRAVTHTPIRAQVRGLATARYSLTMSQEAVADTGGLTISNANQ